MLLGANKVSHFRESRDVFGAKILSSHRGFSPVPTLAAILGTVSTVHYRSTHMNGLFRKPLKPFGNSIYLIGITGLKTR